MDNIKDDRYYIDKIIIDLGSVIEHTKGMSKEEMEENALLIDSIMFRIVQVAENINRLTPEFRNEHKNIPWLAIKGMRNKIVHDYGVVSMTIVYDTVINHIPKMYEMLVAIRDGQ